MNCTQRSGCRGRLGYPHQGQAGGLPLCLQDEQDDLDGRALLLRHQGRMGVHAHGLGVAWRLRASLGAAASLSDGPVLARPPEQRPRLARLQLFPGGDVRTAHPVRDEPCPPGALPEVSCPLLVSSICLCPCPACMKLPFRPSLLKRLSNSLSFHTHAHTPTHTQRDDPSHGRGAGQQDRRVPCRLVHGS